MVAEQQKDLPTNMRCKRQNIETLLSSNFKTTHYITALAMAMGTTAEVLMSGKWTPENAPEPPRPEKEPEGLTLENAFDLLSAALLAQNEDSRRHILDAINLYCRNPKAGSAHRRYVVDALRGGSRKWVANE